MAQWTQINQAGARQQRSLRETAAGAFVGAGVAHFLSIFLGLVATYLAFSSQMGDLTWGQVLYFLDTSGLLGIFLLGVFGQVAFGLLGFFSSFYLSRFVRPGQPLVIGPLGLVVCGAFAIFFSFLLFGGIAGAVGGGLLIGGGAAILGSNSPGTGSSATLPPLAPPPPP